MKTINNAAPNIPTSRVRRPAPPRPPEPPSPPPAPRDEVQVATQPAPTLAKRCEHCGEPLWAGPNGWKSSTYTCWNRPDGQLGPHQPDA